MSLILITFSLDLCIDTVRRNLMLARGCWLLLGLRKKVGEFNSLSYGNFMCKNVNDIQAGIGHA